MKIFCIGFNKTGTRTIQALFQHFGLRACHEMYSQWKDKSMFDKYDVFTDGELHDFEWLSRTFPHSKFILNTRSLEDWILSRIKWITVKNAKGYFESEWSRDNKQAIKMWTARRRQYYARVFKFFEGKPNRLMVVNVTRGDFFKTAKRLAEFAGMPNKPLPSEPIDLNKTPSKNPEVEQKHRDLIHTAFREMGLSPQHWDSDM